MERHHFFLIPGFFGFADLGGITYFHHVREELERLLAPRGVEADVHYVATLPTASIRKRAHRLFEQVREVAAETDCPIHLIGHSTGGLDAKLFTTPTVALLEDAEHVEPLARRVETVVSVATPHLGTPLAFFFNSLLGQNLLYLLSLATVYALRFGRFPLATLFSIVGIVTRLDDRLGWEDTIVDQFYENLFADFDNEHMSLITSFLESIREDQALLGQLTPGGIDLLNAAAEDREGTRYACVITQARRPELRVFREIGFEPYRQASHLIYDLLYRLTSLVPNYPEPSDEVKRVMAAGFGALPARGASDGVVPTWSQLHGEIIHTAWADHLDVCGHFSDGHHDPPHVDWLSSGTGFTRAHFEALWADVVGFIARGR